MNRALKHLALLPIVVAAAALRLFGLNWDDGHHLHPDERFIAMVAAKITLPQTIGEYFDTARSPLNPYNNGFEGFAYGTLPLFLGRWLGELTGQTGYDQVVPLGRALSGLFDVGTIVFVYLLANLLYGWRAAWVASLVLAFSVLNIQLSHFYAFDTFTTFFVAWSLYFAYRAWMKGGLPDVLLLGLGIGMAVACKISAITLVPIALLALVLPWPGRTRSSMTSVGGPMAVLAASALAAYRVAEPYAFLGNSPFDLRPNPRFIADMLQWIRISSGDVEVPYMIQWANTPNYTFVLESIVRWGLGPAAGLAALAGLVITAFRLRFWGRDARHLLLVCWTLLNLVYFGGQFAKFMRYLLPVYPALAVLAGYFVHVVWQAASDRQRDDPRSRWLTASAACLSLLVIVPTLLWALAFARIYTEPNTRLLASRWLLAEVPDGSVLAVEHWDDGLPLGLPGKERKNFREVSMNLYDDESADKLRKVLENLNRADYILLASNRLYGSIPRLPQRYPLATEYYRALFDGRLGFEKVAEFTSRPTLLGFEIVDDAAQEDFTVYDHPKIQVFRRAPDYEPTRPLAALGAVSLQNVQRVKPVEAASARPLLLSPTEWASSQAGGTWSAIFDRDDLANSFPVIAWWLAASALGLAAWPSLWRLTPHLGDRGYGLARVLGILLVAYFGWLLASLKLTPFGRSSLFLGVVLLAIFSALVLLERRSSFQAYLRTNWRSLVLSEAAFTLGFLICLSMRLVNPDLWHGTYGGEKPMDFAYLNAVIKSDYFPPYDPWFAGGAINYYYFGFVMVAALVKLTGIVPATAYNLALALWFGLLCQCAFSVAYNLALPRPARGRPRQRMALAAGALAVVLVALAGNIDGGVQLVQALWKTGGLTFESSVPMLAGVVKAGAGLIKLAAGRGRLEFDFWRSTRLIGPEDPGPIHEFPFFSFLYGDLHAHILALPLTLLALGLSVELLRWGRARRVLTSSRDAGRPASTPPLGPPSGRAGLSNGDRVRFLGLLGLLALTAGALRATNTWDFPTYLAVALLALVCLFRPLHRRRLLDGPLLAAMCLGFVFVLSSLLFAPYLERNQLLYAGVQPVQAHTEIWQFLTINIVWIIALGSWLAFELGRRASLIRPGPESASLGVSAYYSLALPAPLEWPFESGWRVGAIGTALVALALAGLGLGSLALVVVLMVGLIVLGIERWSSRETLFKVGLALIALGALGIPELVAIKGDVGRMNTVFKFYLQAWTILAILSAVLLVRLIARSRRGWPFALTWRRVWVAGLVVLLATILIYPLRGAPVRLGARFAALPPTLDGMAFMQKASYRDRDRDVQIQADYPALNWMQDHIAGSPVVLEANTGLYKWGSRVSVYTGLPTVIGWDWHQKQQRTGMAGAVDERLKDVKAMYETPRLEQALPLMRKYGVSYIYVGGLERAYYPAAGLRKFEDAPPDLLEVAYDSHGVTIYRLKEAR